jgi:ABC-type transporter MlaC component
VLAGYGHCDLCGRIVGVAKVGTRSCVSGPARLQIKARDKKSERVEQLKQIINPIFDYDEIARHTLGAHWHRRSPAEQEEFIRLFRAFLEHIYADRIDNYDNENNNLRA